jgi:Icc-related predicted phosphoesterase/ribosomal protein S14
MRITVLKKFFDFLSEFMKRIMRDPILSELIKIIVIADLHQGAIVRPPPNIQVISQEKLIQNLIKREPDVIMVAGDLQDYMWELGEDIDTINLIKDRIKKDKVLLELNNISTPIYFVWGNTDVMGFEKDQTETSVTNELRKWFTDEFQNFHGCHLKIHNFRELYIVGYDDANKTLEESSGKCWDESDLVRDFQPLIQSLDKNKRANSIFLTHTAPRGILDFSSLGSKHIGSFFLREIIEDYQPLLSVFGHVHYLGGYSEYLGRTQCINGSSFGLAVSHEILFGQSAFELLIQNGKSPEIISTKMIVPYYWVNQRQRPFVEYRKCQACDRHTPFARKQFKICRICLAARRIENQMKSES